MGELGHLARDEAVSHLTIEVGGLEQREPHDLAGLGGQPDDRWRQDEVLRGLQRVGPVFRLAPGVEVCLQGHLGLSLVGDGHGNDPFARVHVDANRRDRKSPCLGRRNPEQDWRATGKCKAPEPCRSNEGRQNVHGLGSALLCRERALPAEGTGTLKGHQDLHRPGACPSARRHLHRRDGGWRFARVSEAAGSHCARRGGHQVIAKSVAWRAHEGARGRW